MGLLQNVRRAVAGGSSDSQRTPTARPADRRQRTT
jgi:hypothetical protein